jgi:hypothetical protein
VVEGHDGRFEIITWTHTGRYVEPAVALPSPAKAA